MRSTFWRVLKMAAPFKGWMALAVLLGFAAVGSSIGLMSTSAYIIAKAALRPSIADLQVAIVGVRFFGLARGVFRYLERLVSHHVTFSLLARLRVWFYAALEPLAPARLIQYQSGDLLSRIVADVETLEHFFGRVIAPPLVAALVGGLIAALLGGYDAKLAVAQLAFLALAGVGVPLLTQRLSREPGRQLVTARAELNAAMVDGVQGVAELMAFGQGQRHLERVGALNHKLVHRQERMAWIGGLHGALTGLLVNLATLVALVVAIPLVGAGQLDGVHLAVLVLAVIASFEAVAPLPLAAQHLESSLEAAWRLFEIVDARPAVQDPLSPSPTPHDYSLKVEGLSFRYGPGEPLALDGVDFLLRSGGSLALVGPSGAGKSTLIRLLLRFFEYEHGHILLGGQELRTYRQNDLRRMFSVVSQHTHLFNGTVRNNLLLAQPNASEADLIQAARRAQIHAFIETLPQGYDTWIGEQGLRLSGGQRRRLVIACALLQDAPFLILDEATSDLDPLTERDVMGAIRDLMAHKTTLIITHRLVGLDIVDHILVLRTGRIVEQGRHHDLLQTAGVYRRLWESQNQLLLDAACETSA